MKKYSILIILIIGLSYAKLSGQQGKCNPDVMQTALSQLDSDTEFLKDFQVYLNEQVGDSPPFARFAMVLREDVMYQFSIASDDELSGQAVFQLFEEVKSKDPDSPSTIHSSGKLIGTTYFAKTGRSFKTFFFDCKKGGVYLMEISFVDGKEGCAVGIIGVKK